MRSSRIAAVFLALGLVAGCGSETTPPPASDVSVAPPVVRFTFQIFGTPGPWWREDASRAEFDLEANECVTESNAARAMAEDGAEAAYRAFIECMTARGWKRGTAPPILPPA